MLVEKKMSIGYFLKTAFFGTIGWIGLSFGLLIIFFPIGILMFVATPLVPFIAPFVQLKKDNKQLIKQHKENMVMRFLEQQTSK